MGDDQDGYVGELEEVFGLASDVGLAGSATVGAAHDDEVGVPLVGAPKQHLERMATIGSGAGWAEARFFGEGDNVAEGRGRVAVGFGNGDEVELCRSGLRCQLDGVGGGGEGRR